MKRQPANVAILLSASLFVLVFSGGSTQVTRAHLSPDGGRCINFAGVQYERASDWNFAIFYNYCEFRITIDYTRIDPVDRRTLTNSATLPAATNGSGSRTQVLIFKSTSLEWTERFPD